MGAEGCIKKLRGRISSAQLFLLFAAVGDSCATLSVVMMMMVVPVTLVSVAMQRVILLGAMNELRAINHHGDMVDERRYIRSKGTE